MSNDHQAHLTIQKQLKENQTKFVYYIIALCVACIGFAVNQTVDDRLNLMHIFIGSAVLSWMLSAFYGFRFLEIFLDSLALNNRFFDIIRANEEDLDPTPIVIETAKKSMIEQFTELSQKSKIFFSRQLYCFYIGIILFLVWHILTMI